MARMKRTLTPPVLGSPKSIPVGGIENDPLRRLLQAIIAASGDPTDAGPAKKYLLVCVDALEQMQQIRWQMCDEFHSYMERQALTQAGAAAVMKDSPDAQAMRLEATRQAVVGGIGDQFRDGYWAAAQRFLDAGAKVESTIAKGEVDADTFSSLKSDDRRALVDILKDCELRQDVFSRPLVQTWEVLRRASKAGDTETTKRLTPHAEARAMQVMRMSPDELGKSEISGVPSDDSLNRVRTVAMRTLAFAQAYRTAQIPDWIQNAKACWAMLDGPRRELLGPSVDYMVRGEDAPDKVGDSLKISPARFLDWRTVDPTAHVRFLTFPVKLGGWTPAYAQDHTGKNPGGVVRLPPVVSAPSSHTFGVKQAGGR